MVEVSTSILNIEENESLDTFYDLEVAGTSYYHIDVMDGKFVEENTVKKMKTYCEYLKNISNIPLDVHLMVKDVKKYIDEFLVYNPNLITFHIEAQKTKTVENIRYVKENNTRVGLSIKPNTPLEKIYEFLPYIHNILIMSVEPGKGGQEILPEVYNRIKVIKKYIEENDLEVDIEVDGGINLETCKDVKQSGADILVAGTAIIKSKDFKETIKCLKNC